jgi:hypothetical protein
MDLLECYECGALYNRNTIVAEAASKEADVFETSNSIRTGDPEQKSVLCKKCGALVYRTVDGEEVYVHRKEWLENATVTEKKAHPSEGGMTSEEKAKWPELVPE